LGKKGVSSTLNAHPQMAKLRKKVAETLKTTKVGLHITINQKAESVVLKLNLSREREF
jgi:hypothetical protein